MSIVVFAFALGTIIDLAAVVYDTVPPFRLSSRRRVGESVRPSACALFLSLQQILVALYNAENGLSATATVLVNCAAHRESCLAGDVERREKRSATTYSL